MSPTAAATTSGQASQPRKPVTPEKPAWGRVRLCQYPLLLSGVAKPSFWNLGDQLV